MFGAWFRNAGFWVSDFVLGKGKKRKCYKDIAIHQGLVRQDRLKAILQYTIAHVPYYKNIKSPELSEFPVMTKLKFREKAETEFLSDEFEGQNLHTVYTSGSTGTPFKVVQNAEKRNRTVCDLVYCHNRIGWKLGTKYIFIRNWVSNYKQSKLKSFMQNVYNVNIATFDDAKKKELALYLKKHKKCVLFGYASAMKEFLLFIQREKIDCKAFKVKLIVCDSDMLSIQLKRNLEQAFECPVFNRYDNEENGLFGITKAYEEKLYLNTASIYFEILKLDSDEPVESGEIGRIVLTDLYNRAMPLIRYDTGDLGVSLEERGAITTLEQLHGRVAGQLTATDGRAVSNVMMAAVTEPFTGIVKYQMVQKKNYVYILKYVGRIEESDREQLLDRLRDCFGAGEFVLEQVEDIALGKNGKYQTAINEDKV
ncbi:MAG: hypothetical protein IJE10_09280 [Clostridia bacterium]|nr:hypothetical protein [Clostridia bacterium]